MKPSEKGKYIKIILALLQSTSTAVVYECAVTLVSLSQAPTAIRAAANCYCQLLVSQSDNNVKLIVLDRLQVRDPTAPGFCVQLELKGWKAQAFSSTRGVSWRVSVLKCVLVEPCHAHGCC